MRENRLSDRLINKAKGSKRPLLKKLGKSLDRDRKLSLAFRARKAMIYLKSMAVAPYSLRKCNSVGSRPRTRKMPNIENEGQIIIGNDVNINSRNVRTDLVTGPSGVIRIGDEVSLNFGVSVVAYKQVILGDRVRVGPYSMIYDSDFHKQNNRYVWAEGDPVTIESDVWLATRVIVLKGSLIGRGSVIASGSVVSGFIPPYVVAGGVPAKIIKYLQPPENHSDFLWGQEITGRPYSSELFEQVKGVIREKFPEIKIDEQGQFVLPASGAEPDSFIYMKLIRALEKEFGITIRKKDWTRLSEVGKICKVIQSKLNSKTAKVDEHITATNMINQEQRVYHS